MKIAKKKTELVGIIAFLLILSLKAYGQYSITAADYPTVGIAAPVTIDTTGSITVDLGSAGENQTWNFTQNLSGLDLNLNYVDPKTTTFADSFPTANLAMQSYEWFSFDAMPPLIPEPIDTLIGISFYEQIKNDALSEVGVSTENPLFSGGFPFENPATRLVFPLEVGKNWLRKSVFYPEITLEVPGLGVVTVNLSYSDSSLVEVDASGDLTIPLGTFKCVRLKVKNFSRIEVLSITLGGEPFPLPIPPIIGATIGYEWYTKNAGMILYVVSQADETDENFTNASLVFRLASNIVSDVECDPSCSESALIPSDFVLKQNYPNPFNPTTSIKYVLPKPANIELTVFSMLGQEVATLESEVKNAGTQETTWNGKDDSGRSVPSGIYFYQLKATPLDNSQPFVQIKKMIMTK